MKMKSHLIVMGAGFIVLLVVSRFIGISSILLFFLLCFFMMAAMLLGMSHSDTPIINRRNKLEIITSKGNKMNKESMLYTIIGVLGGSLLTLIVATTSVNADNRGMMGMMGIHSNQATTKTDNSMGMDVMTGNLKGKTGEDFDKAFLSEMIVHHQGAIDMATLAKQNAKHDEIKKLADDIVAAQTKEISEMKQWQQQWGYGVSSDSNNDNMMMSH